MVKAVRPPLFADKKEVKTFLLGCPRPIRGEPYKKLTSLSIYAIFAEMSRKIRDAGGAAQSDRDRAGKKGAASPLQTADELTSAHTAKTENADRGTSPAANIAQTGAGVNTRGARWGNTQAG